MLPLAVALGRVDVTTTLLDAGVDVDTQVASPSPRSSCSSCRVGMPASISRRTRGLTLMIAVLRGDLELARTA
jgi:hypothetical protein